MRDALPLKWMNPLNVATNLKKLQLLQNVQTIWLEYHSHIHWTHWCEYSQAFPKRIHIYMGSVYGLALSISFVKITFNILTDTDTNYFGVYLSFDHYLFGYNQHALVEMWHAMRWHRKIGSAYQFTNSKFLVGEIAQINPFKTDSDD